MSETAKVLREQARECEVNDGWTPEGTAFMYDAADEIERLQTALAEQDRELCCEAYKAQQRAENERLQRKLTDAEQVRDLRWKMWKEVTAEAGRLREENDKLREISLRRYTSCMSAGYVTDGVYVPTSWQWSCSLCGAESFSDSDTENLDHKADCPIRWVRETSEAARSK